MNKLSISRLVRLLAPLAVAMTAAVGLAAASTAAADSTLSGNWAGYAAHRGTFQSVSARWHQPVPRCTRGQTRYSAMWVGLGGYAFSSTALEQIGTELDCNAKGHTVSNAWYELVPGPSHQLKLKVRPGDLVTASVRVVGQRVTVSFTNLSRHRSFTKTITTYSIDVSSADWILEAPSVCVAGTSNCRTLPLTNFQHAEFAVARARPVGGALGTIADAAWVHTKITLGPSGPAFVSNRRGTVPVATARPSALINHGSSFKIVFRKKYVPSNTYLGPALRGRTYVRH